MIIDIIIVVVLILGIYMGYNKGFVNQLFSIVSLVFGYFISLILSSRLAILLAQFIPFSNNSVVGELNSKISTLDLNIPTGYYKIISFFIIFFSIRLLFRFVGNILGVIRKIPVIKTFNSMLGAIIGLVEAYVIIFVIVYLLYVLPLGVELSRSLLEAKLPRIIFEQTPLLSDYLLERFFNYYKK